MPSSAGFRCVCTTRADRWRFEQPDWAHGVVDALGSAVEGDAIVLVVHAREPLAFVAARLLLRRLPKGECVLVEVGRSGPPLQASERGIVDELESEVRLVLHCVDGPQPTMADAATVARALARPSIMQKLLLAGDRAARCDAAAPTSDASRRDEGERTRRPPEPHALAGHLSCLLDLDGLVGTGHGPCHAFVTHHPPTETAKHGYWRKLASLAPIGSCVSAVLHITGVDAPRVVSNLDELSRLRRSDGLHSIEPDVNAASEDADVVGFWLAGARASARPRLRAEGLDAVVLWREFGARVAPLFPGERMLLPARERVPAEVVKVESEVLRCFEEVSDKAGGCGDLADEDTDDALAPERLERFGSNGSDVLFSEANATDAAPRARVPDDVAFLPVLADRHPACVIALAADSEQDANSIALRLAQGWAGEASATIFIRCGDAPRSVVRDLLALESGVASSAIERGGLASRDWPPLVEAASTLTALHLRIGRRCGDLHGVARCLDAMSKHANIAVIDRAPLLRDYTPEIAMAVLRDQATAHNMTIFVVLDTASFDRWPAPRPRARFNLREDDQQSPWFGVRRAWVY